MSRDVYISKYLNPETEASINDVWIQCEYIELEKNLRVAYRMRPDKIIVDYKSFLSDDE